MYSTVSAESKYLVLGEVNNSQAGFKAWPGVFAAIVLGFSRAFGETMAVLMVVGNMPQVPGSIFDAAYPLTALIANNYGEMMSIPMYDAALLCAALILLLMVLFFNLISRLILVRLVREK